MKTAIKERVFHFRRPARTSRGVYTERRSWMVELSEDGRVGVGECAPLPDLSCDAVSNYGIVLASFCKRLEETGRIDYEAMRPFPSMLFGLETAWLTLHHGDRLFDTSFSRGESGITINGLVWMGTFNEMMEGVEQKLEQGFGCVKLKVGAIDFYQELELVKHVRKRFSHHDVELRLDANGGFSYDEALYRLELLSQYVVHSIEQPIKQRQWANMAELCRESPLPIALDEELIGVNDVETKQQLLNIIKPAYIVLKPSLHGGIQGCSEWINLAKAKGIGWWMTSALESNVGLNAIAQFVSSLLAEEYTTAQGLGTGQLFTDNILMPLEIRGQQLWRLPR